MWTNAKQVESFTTRKSYILSATCPDQRRMCIFCTRLVPRLHPSFPPTTTIRTTDLAGFALWCVIVIRPCRIGISPFSRHQTMRTPTVCSEHPHPTPQNQTNMLMGSFAPPQSSGSRSQKGTSSPVWQLVGNFH
jgi:hypothetical protein